MYVCECTCGLGTAILHTAVISYLFHYSLGKYNDLPDTLPMIHTGEERYVVSRRIACLRCQ